LARSFDKQKTQISKVYVCCRWITADHFLLPDSLHHLTRLLTCLSLFPNLSIREQGATADMSDLGDGQNRLPAAVRRNFIACFVISIILMIWMLYVSNIGVISAVPSSYWSWYTRGELFLQGWSVTPDEARAIYAPWLILVAALLVSGDTLLLLAAILSIVISSKGISGRSAGVELEVLLHPSPPAAANHRLRVIVENRLWT
jgi:hypothetical protein